MVIVKGEALYNMGEFERALVQYERGSRVRKVINYYNPNHPDQHQNHPRTEP